jgi:hypothetical protein
MLTPSPAISNKPGPCKDAKNPIVALVERGGRLRSFLTADVTARNVGKILPKNVQLNPHLITDRYSQKHDEYRQPCPRGPLPWEATRVEHMKRKLQTRACRAIYAARKTIMEPVFGRIKQARGFRQFLLHGLAKVRGEWTLVCLTHDILKLHRLRNG